MKRPTFQRCTQKQATTSAATANQNKSHSALTMKSHTSTRKSSCICHQTMILMVTMNILQNVPYYKIIGATTSKETLTEVKQCRALLYNSIDTTNQCFFKSLWSVWYLNWISESQSIPAVYRRWFQADNTGSANIHYSLCKMTLQLAIQNTIQCM